MHFLLVVVSLYLVFIFVAAAKPLPPVVIGHTMEDHEGGIGDSFASRYREIRQSHRPVIIDGPCVSACTIVASLSRSQVCITPNALQDWIVRHGGLTDDIKWVGYDDLLAIFPKCK